MISGPSEPRVCQARPVFELLAATDQQLFQDALDRFYDGVEDPLTIDALER